MLYSIFSFQDISWPSVKPSWVFSEFVMIYGGWLRPRETVIEVLEEVNLCVCVYTPLSLTVLAVLHILSLKILTYLYSQ